MPTTEKERKKFPQGGKLVSHAILERGEDLRMGDGWSAILENAQWSFLWTSCTMQGNPRQSWIPDSRQWTLDSLSVELAYRFQPFVGFPIPRGVFWTSKSKIQIPSTKHSWTLDSTSKIFLDSRFPYRNEVPTERGGYFRIFWVGMCCWDSGTLNLYQS